MKDGAALVRVVDYIHLDFVLAGIVAAALVVEVVAPIGPETESGKSCSPWCAFGAISPPIWVLGS